MEFRGSHGVEVTARTATGDGRAFRKFRAPGGARRRSGRAAMARRALRDHSTTRIYAPDRNLHGHRTVPNGARPAYRAVLESLLELELHAPGIPSIHRPRALARDQPPAAESAPAGLARAHRVAGRRRGVPRALPKGAG